MFRCQYSNEVSSAAVYQMCEVRDNEGKTTGVIKTLVTSAECPVTIVVSTRQQTYTNFQKVEGKRGEPSYLDQNKTFLTYGTEVVREIKVRPQYEQEVRDLVASGQLDRLKKAFRKK